MGNQLNAESYLGRYKLEQKIGHSPDPKDRPVGMAEVVAELEALAQAMPAGAWRGFGELSPPSSAAHGDSYSYEVDKFWTVVAVQPDRKVVVRTRRGKQLTVEADDPALRRAAWWERFLFRRRFPEIMEEK